MKREKTAAALIAASLGFALSFGAVGCMISGFQLTVTSLTETGLICAAASLLCAGAFSRKRGGFLILCLVALLSGFLWHRGQAEGQIIWLLSRVSRIYDKAYGWGALQLAEGIPTDGLVDIPMGILGALIAMTTAWTVCRGKPVFLAVTAALLPLALCMVVTDTVPKEGYLFLLFLGLIVLLFTAQVRRGSHSQANRLTAMVIVPVAAALAAVFLAVPQKDYVNQSEALRQRLLSWAEELPQNVESASRQLAVSVTGSASEEVNLAAVGRRIELTYPVMEVTAETGDTLYLRQQDYDLYDGKSWKSTRLRQETFSCQGVDLGEVIIRTRGEKDVVFLPYYPSGGMTLYGGKLENAESYREYTIQRTGLPDNWEDRIWTGYSEKAPEEPVIAGIGKAGAEAQLRYRALPTETMTRAEVLLETILTGEETIPEIAGKIAAYVRGSATYSQNTGRMPGEETDFSLWFLEEADSGYCIHFATAAAVLLRAAGVEARYVSGYMIKTVPGVPVTVTGAQSHAWAEYYEPSVGAWILLEATPGIAEAAPSQPTEAEQTLPVPTEPAEQPTGPTPSQPQSTAKPGNAGQTDREFRVPDWLIAAGKAVLFLAAAVVLTAAQRSLRLWLRQKKQRTGPPNVRALALWQEVVRLNRLLGKPAPEGLEQLAQRAKFSQHTLSEEELAEFESELRTARRVLREKPFWLRPVYRYVFAAY